MTRINRIFVLVLLASLFTEYQFGLIGSDPTCPSVESVRAKAENAIREIDNAVGSLKQIKSLAILHHKRINTAKTVGSVVGTLGTIGTTVASVLACVTGGASLFLVIPSIVASVAGGATTFTADVIDSKKTKEYNQNAYNFFVKATESFEELKEEIAVAYELIETVKKDMIQEFHLNEDEVKKIFGFLAKDGVKIPIAAYNTYMTVEFYKAHQLTNVLSNTHPQGVILAANAGLKVEIGSMRTILNSKANLNSKLTTIRSMISKKAAFHLTTNAAMSALGLGLSIWELTEVVKSWKSNHPSVDAVDSCMEKLSIVRKSVIEIKTKLSDKKCSK